MKRVLVCMAAVAMAAGSPARAEVRKGALEPGGFFFFARFDNDSNVDDTQGLGGRFGILFHEQHEMEFAWEHSSTEDDFFGEDVDLDTFKAGYVFNILPDNAVSPFVTVGGGFQYVEIEAFHDDFTDTLGYGGGGVRFFISDSFHVRLDGVVELIFPEEGSEDILWDTLLQAGVGWVLGGR